MFCIQEEEGACYTTASVENADMLSAAGACKQASGNVCGYIMQTSD